jgi:hypothetical protein
MNKRATQKKAKTKHDSSDKQKVDKNDAVDSSCPYCADPTLLDAPEGEPGEETYPVPHGGGRFWRKSGAPSILHGFSFGARWVADVPSEYFSKMFADFSVRIVGVEIGFFLPGFVEPPPPFSNHLLMHLRGRLPFVPAPAKGSAPTVAYILFSGCVINHENGGVEVRAHWWPSHGWIIHQQVALTASDPVERNAQLEHAYKALDFFLLETRGAPKVKDADVFQTIKALGQGATQAEVAKQLGVGKSTIGDWLKRNDWKWNELKRRYLGGEIL